jgi:hypothetical protein
VNGKQLGDTGSDDDLLEEGVHGVLPHTAINRPV